MGHTEVYIKRIPEHTETCWGVQGCMGASRGEKRDKLGTNCNSFKMCLRNMLLLQLLDDNGFLQHPKRRY